MWALQYWIYMDRRVELDDKSVELERQCFNLDPDRWGLLYREAVLPGLANGDYGQAFDGEPELPITDPDELDRWFDQLSAKRGITGEEAIAVAGPGLFLGHAEGEGRRV